MVWTALGGWCISAKKWLTLLGGCLSLSVLMCQPYCHGHPFVETLFVLNPLRYTLYKKLHLSRTHHSETWRKCKERTEIWHALLSSSTAPHSMHIVAMKTRSKMGEREEGSKLAIVGFSNWRLANHNFIMSEKQTW